MGLYQDWYKTRVQPGNYKVDVDNQSFDCVDVYKDYGQFLFKTSWTTVTGWGNAKDHWSKAPSKYWSKSQTPRVGSVVCMGGGIGGGYGHIAVVVGIDGNDILVAEQNTFTQTPIRVRRWSKSAAYIQGYLFPKTDIGATTIGLEEWQREVAPGDVHYRDEPSTNSNSRQIFKAGEVLDFKGYVRGQKVDNNNVWFVGRHTGGFSWSGGFTDSSSRGLVDLTPKSIEANERQVDSDVMNVRENPRVEVGTVVGTLKPGEIIQVKAYVEGEIIEGNKIWFVTQQNTFVWSGGFTNKTTTGISKQSGGTTPIPPTTPEPVTPNPLPLNTVVNKKNPIQPLEYQPNTMVSVGGQQMEHSAGLAALQMVQAARIDSVTLVPGSGFRSYQTQVAVYDRWVARDGQEKADTYSARPGHSEHQTGLTMDFSPIDESFANSTAYSWLNSNAHKFGFIERYPEGKESITGYIHESWHWRFVGVELAVKVKESGKTLEEYLGVEGGLYPGQGDTAPEPIEPPVVIPPVVVEPPKDPTHETLLEAARLMLLAIISSILTFTSDFLLNALAGVNIPAEVSVQIVTFLTILFRLLDKFAYLKLKQAQEYALSNWTKFWTRFKVPF